MELATHTFSLFDSHHTMSLYIDMKMILPWKCSGSQPKASINFWISRRICNVVNPGNIIHSDSIGSPSIRSNSLYWYEPLEPLQFVFPCSIGLWERTYFSKTQYRICGIHRPLPSKVGSILSNCLYCFEFLNHCSLFSHKTFDSGNSRTRPRHNTESENT